MGCGPSNSSAVPVDGDSASTTTKAYPPPEAFEIPLDDENPESLIKKHPPKRLKRLEEQTSDPPSIEDLEEKLATAEMRRQQFLASRVPKPSSTLDSVDIAENGNLHSVIVEEDETEEADDEDNKSSPAREVKRDESSENG
ncbi:uncharacterized protein LOC131688792 [Topomyia yanbarensis]|uniref:uncharacterized protein LOC131688792 n=1 Tax=Topomyia yanbarensis TaxID=2498891 RepID=UPI00273BE32A|nr:uncharacterized protein LOC131688792 [Topomyia yanbarensis]